MEVDNIEIYLGYCPTCKVRQLRVDDVACEECGTALKRIYFETCMWARIDLNEWCRERDPEEATKEAVALLIDHAKANLIEGAYFEIRELRPGEEDPDHSMGWFHDKSIPKEEVVYQEPKFNPCSGSFIWSRHKV